MQVTCESCGKTYTVSDERVRGRAFKYKCKVCDEYNTVPASGRGPWDLDDQDGDDRPAGSPLPVSIVSSTPPPEAEAGGEGEHGAVEALTPSAPAVAAADDDPVSVSGEAVVPDEEEQGKPAWTASRSEDSVLFSANQLKSIASSRPAMEARSAAPPPAEGPQRAPDSEDSSSRLYDIRAIAAATVDAHPTVVDHGVEEILNIEAGGFRDPVADSPVALRDPKAQPSGLVYAVFAMAAAMLVANVVLGGALYLHVTSERDRPVTVVVSPEDLQGARRGDVAASTAPPRTDAAPAPIDAAGPADASSAWSPDEWADEARAPDHRTAHRDAAAGPERTSERESTDAPPPIEQASVAAPAPEPRSEPRQEPRSEPRTRPEPANDTPLARDVSEALGETSAPGPDPSNLPDTLSTTQVVAVMNAIAGRVRRCGDGTPGTVTVNVTIAGSGRVTGSTVTGDFAGTAVGSCAARTVRAAVFPPFRQASMSVRYPFLL